MDRISQMPSTTVPHSTQNFQYRARAQLCRQIESNIFIWMPGYPVMKWSKMTTDNNVLPYFPVSLVLKLLKKKEKITLPVQCSGLKS